MVISRIEIFISFIARMVTLALVPTSTLLMAKKLRSYASTSFLRCGDIEFGIEKSKSQLHGANIMAFKLSLL